MFLVWFIKRAWAACDSYKEAQTWFECSVLFSWSYQRGLLFPLSLSLPISTLSRRTVNKTSWSNPRQTRICYIFRVWVIIKALLKQISLYLLSLPRIRIILLLNINVALQVCKKSSAEIMRGRKITQISMMRGRASIISIEIFAPFQFVPVRVMTRENHN